jgi:uroporphyrin-III C-methyltransferase/precorrin-2 dehydrogenase/sirohydrochlorin ferrochelatase
MGLGRLDHIVRQLLMAGATAERPAAIVAQGTLPNQRIVTASLGTIVASAAHLALESPALLVVGDVVALQSSLTWFNVDGDPDLSQSA